MTGLWQQDFDFYMGNFYMGNFEEDRPFVMTLDLAAAQHAPVESHVQRLNLIAEMKSPDERGLRSREEADALFQLEDDLVEQFTTKFEAIYLGRIVTGGITDYVFQLADNAVAESEIVSAVNSVKGEYEISYNLENDPQWEFYQGLMWPNPYQMQAIQNRRLVIALDERGDNLSSARSIDHSAYFKEQSQAEEAAKKLVELGFEVSPPELQDSFYGLQFKREDSLAESQIDNVVYQVLDVVLEQGGDYDGWGCEVSK